MTDAEAITLLGNLSAEAQAEENALTGAQSDFDAAKTVLQNAINTVSGRVASMDRHIRYVYDRYGA